MTKSVPPSRSLRKKSVTEPLTIKDCPTREAALVWIATNQLGRRNLTASQKAALALEIEKQLAAETKKRMALGGKMKGKAILSDLQRGQARDQAAKMLGINPHYITDAKKIKRDAHGVTRARARDTGRRLPTTCETSTSCRGRHPALHAQPLHSLDRRTDRRP